MTWLPPRWARRLVIDPSVVAGVGAAILFSPLVLLGALVTSFLLPGRWRGLRLVGFAMLYLFLEAVGLIVAFALWLVSPVVGGLQGPRMQRWHYSVLRSLLDIVVTSGQRLFRLRIVTERLPLPGTMDYPFAPGQLVVAARHAGPGDSYLIANELLMRGRRPRVVLKAALQWDPMIDVYLNRLPNRFVTSHGDLEAIATLAATLGDDDALLIFPEGGNFTPERRLRAIDRLRRAQRIAEADVAERLRYTLPPRTGGLFAALQAAPQADLLVVAHTGLDHLDRVRELWTAIPEDKTLYLAGARFHRDDLVRDRQQGTMTLYGVWQAVDAWVAEHREPGPLVPDARSAPSIVSRAPRGQAPSEDVR